MTEGTEASAGAATILTLNENYRSLFLEMVYTPDDGPESVMATGTGFFYRIAGRTFLVTARHNLSGRHWETNALSQSYPVEPTHLRIHYRSKPPAGSPGYRVGDDIQFGYLTCELLDKNAPTPTPLWLEHPHFRRRVDVAAFPLRIPGDILAMPYEPPASDDRAAFKLWPAQDVSIVGYPQRLRAGFGLPIWTRGAVATEPEIPYEHNGETYPLFLVDARTRKSQSGAPVLSVLPAHTTIRRASDQQVVHLDRPLTYLVGIYTGRITSSEGPESTDLGFVWRDDVIDVVCREGVPATFD